MGRVYIFAEDAQDFSTTGLCGALLATRCEHEEIAGGISAVTLEHPMDGFGKWKKIIPGRIVKCPCRVRTVPEIENGQVVTTAEKWVVKTTATKAQRGVFSKPKGGKKKATLNGGDQVIVTQKGETRYKITYSNKKGRSVNGWMALEGLEFEIIEAIDPTTDGLEDIAPAWTVKDQLFRIVEVQKRTESNSISAYAMHISYDLMGYLAKYENDKPLTAQQAIDGLMNSLIAGCETELYTDSADSRTSCEWNNINAIEALLDPDTGFAARWGLQLVRDDYAMYFLHRAGRNRGTRLEYGKNLLGVEYGVNLENVVTAILPTGVKKNGDVLYLTDDEERIEKIDTIIELPDETDEPARGITNGNYVISPKAKDYAFRRELLLEAEDAQVERGKKGVTIEIARARMLKQAQRLFDEEKVDEPETTMVVRFLELGSTIEYAQYQDLGLVFLWDDVAVADKEHGIEAMTQVQRTVWDCLNERMLEVEIGNVRENAPDVYSWNIKRVSGHKIPPGSLDVDQLSPDLQDELNQAYAEIQAAQELLIGTEEWLDMVEATYEPILQAVKDDDGNITALQLTATDIRAGIKDANDNIFALQVTAEELRTAMTNAQGDISTLKQTANSITASVSTLNGQVQSLILQTAEGIAVKLLDRTVNSAFVMRVAQAPNLPGWGNPSGSYGLQFEYNGAYYGGVYFDKSQASTSYWTLGINAVCPQVYHSSGYHSLWVNPRDGSDIISFLLTDVYSAGQRIRASESITVDSDQRLKRDIEPIEKGVELFDLLRPRQYRMRSAKALSYGFIAQDVEAAVDALGMPETVLLSRPVSENDYYALNYQEIIALCVNKIQAQQAQIDELSARIARLEEKT